MEGPEKKPCIHKHHHLASFPAKKGYQNQKFQKNIYGSARTKSTKKNKAQSPDNQATNIIFALIDSTPSLALLLQCWLLVERVPSTGHYNVACCP